MNNTVTVSQPVTLFRVNEYNWKLSDSFNSTTMRFLFNIKVRGDAQDQHVVMVLLFFIR